MSLTSRFPLGGAFAGEGCATATCYCGTVSLEFSTEEPDLVIAFACHCSDCHKISDSMFCTNFAVTNSSVIHLRGEESLTRFAQDDTIRSRNTMANHFCSKCGKLMYRQSTGFEGLTILRAGTVDNFELMEGILKPSVEQFTEDRARWLKPVEGVRQAFGPGF